MAAMSNQELSDMVRKVQGEVLALQEQQQAGTTRLENVEKMADYSIKTLPKIENNVTYLTT